MAIIEMLKFLMYKICKCPLYRMFGKTADKESNRLKSLHDALGNQGKGKVQVSLMLRL